VAYIQFWETDLKGHTITHWINDGFMTIFFLLIGLELEREVYNGDYPTSKMPCSLSSLRWAGYYPRGHLS
jgi:NhaA family Na+:H+ antiporter